MSLKKLLCDCRIEAAVFVCFAVACAGLAAFYVSCEKYFYISDFNFYHIATITSYDSLGQAPLIFPLFLYLSTKLTHNLLFTALPAFFMLLMGPGRVTFVVSLLLCFTLPYLLALIANLRALVPTGNESLALRRRLFFSALIAVALLPAFWITPLRGYPDNLAALPSIVAVYLYLKANRRLSLKQRLIVGVLLALAPMFRRHYFYSDIACLAALFIDQVLLLKEEKESLAKAVKSLFFTFGTIGASMVGFLCTFGILFLGQVFAANYSNLYKSAYTPPPESFGYFVSAFGMPALLAAALGFVFAYRSAYFEAAKLRFLSIYAVILALIWPSLGTHVAHHYLLYIMPFMVWGLTFFLYGLFFDEAIGKKRAVSILLTVLVLLYGLVNDFIAFSHYQTVRQILPFQIARFAMLRTPIARGDAVSLLFSPSYGPLVRNDLSEVKRLIAYLRDNTNKDDKIFAGASWDIAEADALRNAERYFYGRKNTRLHLLNQAYADSSESYPLERMINSKFILVVSPVFYLYSKPGEYLADVFLDMFDKNWQFVSDFELVPGVYKLDDGYTLKVYRRKSPTLPAVAVSTLDKMRSFVPIVPGGQPIWLDSDDYCETVGESKRDYFSLAPQASDLSGSSGLIDTDKHSHFLLSSKTYRADSTVSGKIGYKEETATKLPQGLQIYLTAYNKDGKKLQTVSALPNADGSFVLALQSQSNAEVYLVLSMTAASSNFDKQFEKLELTSLRINGGK